MQPTSLKDLKELNNLEFPFTVQKVCHHVDSSLMFQIGELFTITGFEGLTQARAKIQGVEGMSFGMNLTAPVFKLVELTNVVSLFSASKTVDKKIETKTEEKSEEALFAEAMQRNDENRKRMMKDRVKENRGVLKSYRLKF